MNTITRRLESGQWTSNNNNNIKVFDSLLENDSEEIVDSYDKVVGTKKEKLEFPHQSFS